MKKSGVAGWVAVAFLSISPVVLCAQSDSVKVLKELIISDSRYGLSQEESARSVQVISREEIQSLPVSTVADLLEMVTAADIRTRGPVNVQSDISTRGGSFEQTLVLINGVPMTDPQTGHHLLNIPLTPDAIDRIEIFNGSGSRIFGPKAFSGAVNIITATASPKQASLRFAGGDYGYYDLSGDASLRYRNQGIRVAGNYQASDGYIQNTDAVNMNVNLQTDGLVGKIRYKVFAGMQDKRFGAQNFYTASFPQQYELINAKFAEVNTGWSNSKWNVQGRAYYRRHSDQFQLFREGPGWHVRSNGFFILGTDTAPTWYKGHNYHLTDVMGAESNVSFRFKAHVISAGIAWRSEEILSNILGEPLSVAEQVPGEPEYAQFRRGGERQEINLYAEDQLTWKGWNFSAGALERYPLHMVRAYFPVRMFLRGSTISFAGLRMRICQCVIPPTRIYITHWVARSEVKISSPKKQSVTKRVCALTILPVLHSWLYFGGKERI